MQTDKDRDALLRGLKKYNALLPNPMHVSEVKIGMVEHALSGLQAGFCPPFHVWSVSYGYWNGRGDTIMGAANDAASKMPTVVAS